MTGGRGARRSVLAGMVGLGCLVLVALLLGPPGVSPPLDPDSTQPDGLRGVIEVLRGAGVDVEVSTQLPADLATDTTTRVFVPVDQLSDSRRDGLLQWVDDGGVLVVVGWQSGLHDLEPAGAGIADLVGGTTRGANCPLVALDGLRVVHASWSGLVVPPGATGCFSPSEDATTTTGTGERAAWLVARERGEGMLVALASGAPLTNAWLDEQDNAVLAAALLGPAPGARLHVVARGGVGEGDDPLLSLVHPGVWRSAGFAAAALLLAVLWRARRLGRPVPERLPPVLPSSELTGSIAGLLQRAGNRQAVADRLRDDARRAVRDGLGLPTTTPDEALVDVVAERTAVATAVARTALAGAPVRTDDDLRDVATACVELRRGLVRRGTAPVPGHRSADR